MNAAASYGVSGFSLPRWLQLGRIGPLGSIILVHIGLFHALRSSAPTEPAHQVHQVPANEVIATFITPEPKPLPSQPQPVVTKPALPKTKESVRPKPVKPKPDTTPSPRAITEPPAPPAPPPAKPAAPPVATALPAPPAPPAPVQPKTMTSGIEYIRAPQPDYPQISRRLREEGKSILQVLVNDKGRAERIEVRKSSGSARLDEAARQAVSRALFKPFIEDGRPVAGYALVEIVFQLDS
jgi:protein TonB